MPLAPTPKPNLERRCASAITSESYRPREIVVRINGFGTDWHDDDLAAVAGSTADGVLVPKVETGQQVEALVAALERLDAPRVVAAVGDDRNAQGHSCGLRKSFRPANV